VTGDPLEVDDFGGGPAARVHSGSLFHFPHHRGLGDFWTFLLSISRRINGRCVAYLAKTTNADKIVHPQHFVTDPTDI